MKQYVLFSYPCKDCTKRYPACSDTCKEFKDAREENAKRKKFLKDADWGRTEFRLKFNRLYKIHQNGDRNE